MIHGVRIHQACPAAASRVPEAGSAVAAQVGATPRGADRHAAEIDATLYAVIARRATVPQPLPCVPGPLPSTAARPLHCPLEPAMSPHAEEAQRWLADWLEARGPAWDDERRRRFERIGFARYAARLYPDAEPSTLRAVSGLFAWFFLLDDAADSVTTPNTERLRALLTRALTVLRQAPVTSAAAGAPSDTDTEAEAELPGLLAEAWRVPGAEMPQVWRDRFVDAVRHHLGGVLVEAEAKSVGRRPGVEAYVRLRRATSAAYVAHVLTEFAVRAPLPDAVHGHPAVRAYSTAGNDLLSWFNDLLSLDRDEATAGGHNLVLALAAEHGLSTADAVALAVSRWQDLMDSFADLRAAVPSFGRELDVSVEHYLNGVDRSVRGTIDWSLETVRYQPPPLVATYLT
jgi:hypothetical protein